MRWYARRTMVRSRSAVCLTTACVVGLLAACAAPDERAELPDLPPGSASATVGARASGTDALVVAPPAVFGAACLRGDPALGETWRVQGVADSLAELPLVQLAGLPMRDSTRLAARVTRAADVLPADTTMADFRGLPVVIRAAWILQMPEEDTAVIALVARRLPIESAPLEEFLTVIATPDSAPSARGALRVAWHTRDAGEEERLITYEPVAAFRAPDASPRILLVRESMDRPQVVMLGRDPQGAWSRLWEGELPVCP